MARKKLAQIFTGVARLKVIAQETLDRVRHIVRRAAIADRPREACMFADSAAQAEVVSVLGAALGFDLFAFQADIGNPVLAATVGAASDVELQLLVKLGQPLFE